MGLQILLMLPTALAMSHFSQDIQQVDVWRAIKDLTYFNTITFIYPSTTYYYWLIGDSTKHIQYRIYHI